MVRALVSWGVEGSTDTMDAAGLTVGCRSALKLSRKLPTASGHSASRPSLSWWCANEGWHIVWAMSRRMKDSCSRRGPLAVGLLLPA